MPIAVFSSQHSFHVVRQSILRRHRQKGTPPLFCQQCFRFRGRTHYTKLLLVYFGVPPHFRHDRGGLFSPVFVQVPTQKPS